jgi:hypothetical protein
MREPQKMDETNNEEEIPSAVDKLLSDEPRPGDTLDDIDYTEQEPILATPRREIKDKEIIYRILFPEEGAELVMIIPPKISIGLARKALADLKTLSTRLHQDFPEELTLAAKIYLEYELLSEKFGWSDEDISQQVNFDLLVTKLILEKEKPGTPIYEYAKVFQDALIKFIRTPRTKQDEFASLLNVSYDDNQLPFIPETGFKFDKKDTRRKISDSLKAWKLDFQEINVHREFRGVLASFWAISFLSHYWQALDLHEEMCNYNRERRNELISSYMEGVVSCFGGFFKSGPISDKLLQKFIDGIMPAT